MCVVNVSMVVFKVVAGHFSYQLSVISTSCLTRRLEIRNILFASRHEKRLRSIPSGKLCASKTTAFYPLKRGGVTTQIFRSKISGN